MRTPHIMITGTTIVGILALGGWRALTQDKPKSNEPPGETEVKVAEADVPKAAMDALKKLAGAATIKELAKETEHGHTFYEGSWAGPNGNIDALVTDSGDLVEIEEIVPAGSVPSAVTADAKKEAGKDASVTYEKKTVVLYEAHFKKDGKGHELVFTPDGRRYKEPDAKAGEEDEDEDKD